MRSIRALAIAAAASSTLSACVGGLDPQASLRPGSNAALAAVAPAPEGMTQPAPVQRTSAAMPGDLLFDPERTAGGINPIAVLTRSEARDAHGASFSAPLQATAFKPVPRPTAMASRQASRQASFAPSTALMAAPLDLPAGTASPSPAAVAKLSPLAEVEAHAEAEQRAQNLRDRRFDAQVRRASSLVCSGCLSPTRRTRRAQAEDPDTAGD